MPIDTLNPAPLRFADFQSKISAATPEEMKTWERIREISQAEQAGERLADWEGMLGDGFDAVAQRRGFLDRFESVAAVIPRDEVKAKVVRDLFVQDNLPGVTSAQIRSGVPQLQLGKRMFNLTDPSDAAFDTAMKAHIADQVDTRDRGDEARKAAAYAAIQSKDLAQSMELAKAKAGEKWPKIERLAREEHARIAAEYSPEELAAARQLFESAAAGEGAKVEQVGKSGGFLFYGKADQATRDRVMNLIALQAQAEGKDVEGFFQQFGRAVGSGMEDLASGILAGGTRGNAKEIRMLLDGGLMPKDGKTSDDPNELYRRLYVTQGGKVRPGREPAEDARPMEPIEREILQGYMEIDEGLSSFSMDVQTAGVKVRRFLNEEKQGGVRRAVLNAANSLPTMAAAAIPYGVGIVAVASSYRERNLSELRRQGGEVTPATEAAAAVSGLVEAGIDRVQWLTMGAKLPKLTASVLKWGKPGAVLVYGARAGGIAVMETGQEVVQDLTFPAVQEFASALTKDMPGPDWQGVLTSEYEALGDIFGASLVFGIIGATGSSATQYFNRDKLRETLRDRAGLAMAGYSPETVDQVATLADVNVAAAAETLKAAQIETTPEQRKANATAARAVMEQAAKEMPTAEEAAIPSIEKRADGGYQVRYPNGLVDPAESETDAMEAVRMWEADDINQMETANRVLARELERTHADNPELAASFKFTGKEVTMKDWAGKNSQRIEVARQRVRIAMQQELVAGERTTDGSEIADKDLPLDAYLILGSSQNFGGAVTRISAEINKRGNVATVLEEHAEGVAKWLMESGRYSRHDLVRGIRETEAATGKKTLADDLDNLAPDMSERAIVEAFSRLAVANAFGKVQESNLSAKFKALFRAIKEAFSAVLSLAGEIRQLQLAGQMDEQFEYWLDVAGGVSESYQMENLRKAAENELQAAAMEGFPEIAATLKGKLPRFETLRANGAAFAGEVERLYDGLRNSQANGASAAARVRKANEFFLPPGEMADLDQIRQAANAKGFDFETPGEMLDALDLSVNYGKPVYGTGATGSESFSVGRSTVTPTADTKVLPGADGSPTVIGPASFSIRAFHGTPHKVDRFTTEKIGTGEGAQAYGWGLYFAQAEEVAAEYRRILGQEFRVDGEVLMRAGNVGPKFAELKAAVGQDAADIVIAYLDLGVQKVYDELRHPDSDISEEIIGETLAFLDRLESTDSGNFYKVSLKAEEDTLLDWDLPLAEQSEVVRAALGIDVRDFAAEEALMARAEEMGVPASSLPEYAELEARMDATRWARDMTGGEWYREQSNAWAATTAIEPEALSKKLLAAGVRGIRYLDSGSRNVGEGTRNFVIFDEADIEILEENGQPVSAGAGVSFSLGRADEPAIIKSQLHESHLARTGTGEPSQGEGGRAEASLRGIGETLAGREGNAFQSYRGDGQESIVHSFDDGRVLKEIKRGGVNRYTSSGGYSYDFSFEAVAEKARVINALGGMPTSAIETGGRLFLIQDEGTPISQSEYESLVLPGNIVPASGHVFRVEIEGRHYLVSDLHRQNFMKDAAGAIRLTDLVTGEVTAQTNSLPEVNTSSLAAVRANSPLLAAIDALASSPEATAAAFKQMRLKVGEVRDRMDNARRSGGFSEEELDATRFEKLRDIATLEAIAKALPPAFRGKLVGSFARLEDFKTSKGRENYLVKLLPKIEAALEQYLQNQYRAAIRREMQRGAVKVSDAKTRGGKIGATGHVIFDQAKAAMVMEPDAAAQAADAIQAKIEGAGELTLEQLEELDGQLAAIELFHDYENASAARLESALELLKDTYREGRKAWVETLAERRMMREERIRMIRRGLGLTRLEEVDGEIVEKQVRIDDVDRTAALRRNESILHRMSEGFMAAFLSGSQKIRRLGELTADKGVRLVVDDMEAAFAGAEALETDLNIADNEALAREIRAIFKVSTEYQVAKRLRELSEAKGAAPVEKIEGMASEDISVPVNVVESLVAGETSGFTAANGTKIELDAHDVEALADAWERFQDLQEEEQSKRRVVYFTRIHAKGERMTIGEVSQLEGLQLYLTMRQPDQARKLERLGYDEQTMAQLEAWLKPEVKELGAWMTARLKAEQDALDALHRTEKGVALRLVENYFPVRNDVSGSDAGGLSLDGAAAQQSGRSVSFVKERVANNAPPAYVNALAVFVAHRAQSNFWKSHVTAIREWGGVVRDERFAQAVKVRMGGQFYQSLGRMMERIESGGTLAARQVIGFEKIIKGMMRNFSLGTLGLRVSTLMVNTTAALNAGLEIPAGDLVKGIAKALKRPESFKDAWASPVIQRRLKAGSSFEAQLAKAGGPSTRPVLAQLQSLAEKGVAPINVVDTAANLLGAVAVWEHTRTAAARAGLDDALARSEADNAVERLFLRAAQPTARLARSEFEQRTLDNPISGLLSLFISEPRKNLAIAFMAAREIVTGKGTYGKAMAGQQIVVSMLVMVAAEFLIRSFYSAFAKADEDDEDELLARWGEKLTDGKAWTHALTTSHLRAIPLAGEAWNQAIAYATDQKVFDSSPNPMNKVTKWAAKFAKGMGEEKTARDTITGAIDGVQAFGSLVPGGPVFAQLGNVADFAEGVATSAGVDFSEGDRRERIKSRFNRFSKELTELHGPTTGEDGKIRKDVQRKKWQAKADWLRANLAPLPEAERKALLEDMEPGKAILKMLK